MALWSTQFESALSTIALLYDSDVPNWLFVLQREAQRRWGGGSCKLQSLSIHSPIMAIPSEQKAIRWHPPSYDIRVETVPVPRYEMFFSILAGSYFTIVWRIQHPDDAIVKVKVGLGVKPSLSCIDRNCSLLPSAVPSFAPGSRAREYRSDIYS